MKNIVDSGADLGYKYYVAIGAVIGSANSFFVVHSGELIWTFVLGFVGAMGAALAKFLFKQASKHTKTGKE